jgi:hypothetical protein
VDGGDDGLPIDLNEEFAVARAVKKRDLVHAILVIQICPALAIQFERNFGRKNDFSTKKNTNWFKFLKNKKLFQRHQTRQIAHLAHRLLRDFSDVRRAVLNLRFYRFFIGI